MQGATALSAESAVRDFFSPILYCKLWSDFTHFVNYTIRTKTNDKTKGVKSEIKDQPREINEKNMLGIFNHRSALQHALCQLGPRVQK